MNDRDRLGQLEGLLARLEQMPASPERDWMLAEVRGRAVDVKTGMPSTPLRALPRDEVQVTLPAERAPRAEPAPPAERLHKTPSRRAPRGRLVTPACVPPVRDRERSHEEVVDLLGIDGVLNLDDAPAATGDMSRPWARGLRG